MQPRTALPVTPLHASYRSGRSVSLSEQLVGEVRDALFARRLKPGDFLGTENELAARHGVSRMVARDALRTLQALGVAEIKMGKGGGARVARGNPPLLAEALAVQLELSGVTAAEILDAQCAIETLATELAAQHATPQDLERLQRLLTQAEETIGDAAIYTRVSRDFHLAIADASRNRVLAVQLRSLQYVSWPKDNRTLTAKVARHILEVHHELNRLLVKRDALGARRLMDEHVQMIKSRRVPERDGARGVPIACC